MKDLNCFKTYDIRGLVDVELNNDLAFAVGRALVQHFSAKSVVIGHDNRKSSPDLFEALSNGIQEGGANSLKLNLAGTEEMYAAVAGYNACAGVEVTASHNPKNYNGMKIVKSGANPVDKNTDLENIKFLVQNRNWVYKGKRATSIDISQEARKKYINKLLNLIDINALKPMKILINFGNGTAGPTFSAIVKELAKRGSPLEFVLINKKPDYRFPNGAPNPMLLENQTVMNKIVKSANVDFGVAFDGDFDRCFFFDETGNFIRSEHIICVLSSFFLAKEPKSKIIHDSRLIWNIQETVIKNGGIPVISKTGHNFMKKAMRSNKAVYGGEISAHHYFRDFYYCDSGMLPWLIIAEILSKANQSLKSIIKKYNSKFYSLGEFNYNVRNPKKTLWAILKKYENFASIDETDGLSVEFENWRFNLRISNTEPLIRLNVEAKDHSVNLNEKINKLEKAFC